jgi:hydroxypyruvate reductase
MGDLDPRALLVQLFDVAVAAALPDKCLAGRLPPPPADGRVIVLATGKAGGAMAAYAERFYIETHGLGPDRLLGHAVARYGYDMPLSLLPMLQAGHPKPDDNSVIAASAALALAESATERDLVVALISGGGSANWVAPAGTMTLAEKRAINIALLKSGAAIHEVNTVRKHLSRIKGGRLARAAAPARLVAFAVSDVPGDDPATIASGPTVPDPTTLAETRAIIARYGIDLPESARRVLDDPASETPKPGDPIFARTHFEIVTTPAVALAAAVEAARDMGLEVIALGDQVEGEAREVAAAHAAMARDLADAGRRALILSGGELTVTIRGDGRGGPNQEYALGFALAIAGDPRITVLAADTDGTDGGGGSPEDPAGAIADGTSVARASALGLDAAAFLAGNNSTAFFEALGDLVSPGPTKTNVNDFRAIFVHP